MQFHSFPDSDLSVSKLCFGCWGITGDLHWGERVEADSIGAMQAAFDAGVNFYDTAPMYADGASETLLGKFLAERKLRDQVVVATKIRPHMMCPADVKTECEGSLQRLQTDYIDIYQTHWSTPAVPIEDTWGAMRELQAEGKVRHIAVCNAGPGDLADISAAQKPISNQIPYSLITRMIEHEIQPICVEQQIGILVYSPLMHGMLADKYQTIADVLEGRARSRHFHSRWPNTRHGESGCETETFAAIDAIRKIASEFGRTMADIALAWVAQQSGVASVIAGARNEFQFRQNLNFLENPLSDDVLQRLNDATQPVKDALGLNCDLWDGGDKSRYR